ncbi:MAG: DUF2258 domain-containing protein [Candidatus Bathyarchaeia archaeon]
MSLQSSEKVELRTGVIPAALYAGKLRKIALAVFKNLAPRDVILRDVAKLNQSLYGKLVEELKLSKGDFVRISVKAFYDKDKGELSFEIPHIERLVFESDVRQIYEAKMKELEESLRKAEAEREHYRNQLVNLKKGLEELLRTL